MMRIVFLFLILLLGVSNFTQAQELKPLPEPEMANKLYIDNTSVFTKEFSDNNRLNFQVRLPSDFVERGDDQLKYLFKDGYHIGDIFYAYGAGYKGNRPYFSVQSFKQDRFIDIKNWFLNRVLNESYNLRGIKESDDRNSFEAFYVRLNSFNVSEIVRCLGYLHEGQYVLAEYVLPMSLWDRDKDKMIHGVRSFNFMNAYKPTGGEDLQEYEYLDSFIIKYPVSWQLGDRQNIDNYGHMVSLSSRNDKGFELGEIEIVMVSEKSLNDLDDQNVFKIDYAKEIGNLKQVINHLNFVSDPLLESKIYDVSANASFQVTEVYPLRSIPSDVFVNDKKSPIVKEFWLSVVRIAEKAYFVSMMAPSRDVDFYHWAIASKSYEEIIESLR